MAQYWVIEAEWGEKKELKDKILSRGYWYLGENQNISELFDEKKDVMQKGDKIAVKDNTVKDENNSKLKAIGIIKEIDEDKRIISVEWLLEEVKRETFGQGEFKSLEGPFFEKEDWVKKLLESL